MKKLFKQVESFKTDFQDNRIVHPISIANYLREFYSSDDFLVAPEESLTFSPITEEEFNVALSKLKTGKALGNN